MQLLLARSRKTSSSLLNLVAESGKKAILARMRETEDLRQ
jgi:hypothetical protein